MNRRTLLGAIASAPVIAACDRTTQSLIVPNESRLPMTENVVRNVEPLGAPPWRTQDPFLFCVHHDDAYPAGNAAFGPATSLAGRNIGSDFANRDGWNMYHGDVVPGFPSHPHRGFETVTVVRQGLIDHSDSLGAGARYGHGDTQWLTAGRGIVHSEMFPLLSSDAPNPAELFQIWLNLPAADKMVEPCFTMLWRDRIPKHIALDAAGKSTEVTLIAGHLGDVRAPSPPPNSWAHRADTEVAIWTLKLAPGARFTLPPVAPRTNRTLYYFRGNGMRVGDRTVSPRHLVELRESLAATLVNGDDEGELLLLQGRAIGEPVVQHGPFVMNTRAEIQQAFADFQRTRFGGWPWPSSGPVHGPAHERFARHADGQIERG